MEVHESASQLFNEYPDHPIPLWATRFNEGGRYMVAGAQLCTKNGYNYGNAYIDRFEMLRYAHVSEGEFNRFMMVAIVYTDMGTMLRLSLGELKELFRVPLWIMDVEEARKSRGVV